MELIRLLMLAVALTLSAETAGPLVQWAVIQPVHPVDIPPVSSSWSKVGVLVQVCSQRSDVEVFSVTLRYRLPDKSQFEQQVKAVLRTREQQEQWTEVVFWTGQVPEIILTPQVREYAAVGESQ